MLVNFFIHNLELLFMCKILGIQKIIQELALLVAISQKV
ncbi:hypothetical protein BXY57_2210 [Thermoflavifilum aggregans]|uniref:Uncharacterized protein n=1 Tax=Thermoflavifilum aggregans TaxID=454188 RepID=A0A2M9CXF7_9BACT|nr:hypothetical protein BXY57_2210 [Thermoflavifilum aggregans]